MRKSTRMIDPETGCWLWLGGLTVDGYGKTTRNGKTITAHKVSFELVNGRVPSGMELDHRCRVRRCINPEHLEPVAHRENVYRGASTKLTDEQVLKIRLDRSTGMAVQSLAAVYGVDEHTIVAICNGTSRRYTGGPLTDKRTKISRHKGVTFHKKSQKWYAYSYNSANQKVIYLGMFTSESAAATAVMNHKQGAVK